MPDESSRQAYSVALEQDGPLPMARFVGDAPQRALDTITGQHRHPDRVILSEDVEGRLCVRYEVIQPSELLCNLGRGGGSPVGRYRGEENAVDRGVEPEVECYAQRENQPRRTRASPMATRRSCRVQLSPSTTTACCG